MTTQLEELDALGWLKDYDTAEAGPSPEVRARLWARVSHDVNALALVGSGATSSQSGSASLMSSNPGRVLASRLALWSAPALVLGALAGIAGHASLAPEQQRTLRIDQGVVGPASTVETAMVESLVLETEGSPAPSAVRLTRGETAPAASSSPLRTQSPLARERAVLDPARAALATGDPARAFEQTRRHAREFPAGVLSEEREAIAINALVRLGQVAQARRRAQAFRTRYPESLMTHSVEAAIAAAPKD